MPRTALSRWPIARKADPVRFNGLEVAQIGPAASRAEGFRLAALSSVAAAPLRLPPPPCQTRPSPRSLTRAPYLRDLLLVWRSLRTAVRMRLLEYRNGAFRYGRS